MRHFARRSATVTLTLLSGVAAGVLAACRSTTNRYCVDPSDRIVPDSMCTPAHTRVGTGGAGWYPYRYYYGGRGYGGIGTILHGGSYSAPRSSGRSYGGARVGGGTTRGGFGGIGAGHGFSGS
jgi:hypothetical protein